MKSKTTFWVIIGLVGLLVLFNLGYAIVAIVGIAQTLSGGIFAALLHRNFLIALIVINGVAGIVVGIYLLVKATGKGSRGE